MAKNLLSPYSDESSEAENDSHDGDGKFWTTMSVIKQPKPTPPSSASTDERKVKATSFTNFNASVKRWSHYSEELDKSKRETAVTVPGMSTITHFHYKRRARDCYFLYVLTEGVAPPEVFGQRPPKD